MTAVELVARLNAPAETPAALAEHRAAATARDVEPYAWLVDDLLPFSIQPVEPAAYVLHVVQRTHVNRIGLVN